MKEALKREREVEKRVVEFEAQKAAEWKERCKASDDALLATARSHSSAVAAEQLGRSARWDHDIGEMEARINSQREVRHQAARDHSIRHRALTQKSKESKQVLDEAKLEGLRNEVAHTQKRLDVLDSARQDSVKRMARELRDEFHTKSTIVRPGLGLG